MNLEVYLCINKCLAHGNAVDKDVTMIVLII